MKVVVRIRQENCYLFQLDRNRQVLARVWLINVKIHDADVVTLQGQRSIELRFKIGIGIEIWNWIEIEIEIGIWTGNGIWN